MSVLETNPVVERKAARPRGRRRQPKFDAILRLFEQIIVFMDENDSLDCKAYISLSGGEANLFLVSTKVAYDFELGDKLADFAAPYIERGLLGSVTLVPASSPEQLAAYFDPKKAFRFERAD